MLGFAIVKLAQAFLFNDAVVGFVADVDRLREVEAALLGVPGLRASAPKSEPPRVGR